MEGVKWYPGPLILDSKIFNAVYLSVLHHTLALRTASLYHLLFVSYTLQHLLYKNDPLTIYISGCILSNMVLRPASLEDEKRLLIWRNDPVTRHASLTQHIIGKNEHARWLRESLANPNRKIYIAEKDGVPVGTFRIDSETDLLFLSWTIAPVWRQMGLGKRMVKTAEIEEYKPIRAVIRKDNIPSAKLALHMGMSLQMEEDGLLYFLKE